MPHVIETPDGYRMRLSPDDTWDWAHRPGALWPCSETAGHSLTVVVDSVGLCEIAVDGREEIDLDGNELDAIVSDFLPANLRHLWPTWEVRP